jgi:hypothetical protein
MSFFEFNYANLTPVNYNFAFVGNVKEWNCGMHKCILEFEFENLKCKCANYKFTIGQDENRNI